MKKLVWAVLAVAFFAFNSHAQELSKLDVSGSYSYMRITTVGLSMNGFSASAAYNANNWFAAVGDFGFYHASPGGVGKSVESYTFGPRFSIRGSSKVVPYFQALVGASHLPPAFLTLSSANPFTFNFGAGADIAIPGHDQFAFRPQIDNMLWRVSGVTVNEVRIGAGIVYHFGEK
ncbi:MAG TPA: hypothetical protein VJN21_12825 [Candidatus Acidoferrales bacterium]|nr:hypothetical protein [Candidatus Acidoferrales bacterium]